MRSIAGYYIRFLLVASMLALFAAVPSQIVRAEPAGVTVERYYVTWEDEWRTSSTTFVNIEPTVGYYPLNLTFIPAVTGNYMLITSFTVSNSSTARQTSVQVMRNSTQMFSQTFTPGYAADYFTSGYTQVSQLTGEKPILIKCKSGPVTLPAPLKSGMPASLL
jgi:hypothetical protein